MAHLMRFSDLFRSLTTHGERRTVLVAVDGHGGSGKSTFAERLAAQGENARVIHTDDFANLGVTAGLDVERLRRQVIQPLSRDESGRYQRFDWPSQRLSEWYDIPPGDVVIVEGVSSQRREFGDVWDLSIWVEATRNTCLRRGLDRDGRGSLPLWEAWLADEDRYIDREDPKGKADLIVDGDPDVRHDAAHEFVVIEDRRPRRRSPRTHESSHE
jgi:uridine kinase